MIDIEEILCMNPSQEEIPRVTRNARGEVLERSAEGDASARVLLDHARHAISTPFLTRPIGQPGYHRPKLADARWTLWHAARQVGIDPKAPRIRWMDCTGLQIEITKALGEPL